MRSDISKSSGAGKRLRPTAEGALVWDLLRSGYYPDLVQRPQIWRKTAVHT